MIVKVQLPIVTTEPFALVYNRSRGFTANMRLTPELDKALKGRFKSFWYAKLKGKELELLRPAPWQDW